MSEIKVMDCTLRDGGYVNNWEFGNDIDPIITELLNSNVDYIELGFLRDGDFSKNQTMYNKVCEANEIVKDCKYGNFSLMIRPDWYDISQFDLDADKINLIRFAFYMRDKDLTLYQARYVQQKGYKVSLNPVNICSYSDEQIYELIDFVKVVNPDLLMIVDTFGSLTPEVFEHYYQLFDENLSNDIAIGVHLHENMLMSTAIMLKMLEIRNEERNTYLDGTLNGIGRIPGNLPTEILMDLVNSYNDEERYDVSHIVKAISNSIYPIKEKHYWGYSPAYYASGKYKVHRSYPEYYLEKKGIDVYRTTELIKRIADNNDKKWEFDKNYADELLNLK